ncbi:hypothetical protein Vretifemale_4195, partial [Volvox reticuliferus]
RRNLSAGLFVALASAVPAVSGRLILGDKAMEPLRKGEVGVFSGLRCSRGGGRWGNVCTGSSNDGGETSVAPLPVRLGSSIACVVMSHIAPIGKVGMSDPDPRMSPE